MLDITRSGFTLPGLSIRWYGVLIALGVLGAVLICARRESRLGLPKDTTLNLALICVPAGILCARLYYVLFSWDYFRLHPAEIFNLRLGGLAIYGGVLGGAAAALIYARVKKVSFPAIADLLAPGLAFGQALGRWGNFLNQEAYGAPVADPALRFFPVATYIDGSGWHYAAFFYESLWCALICILLLTGEGKGRFDRPGRSKRGDSFLIYAFLYALERFLVEGLRTDSLYLGPMRVSQLLSLIVLLAISVLLCLRRKKWSSYLLIPSACMLGLHAELDIFSLLWALLLLAGAALSYILPPKQPWNSHKTSIKHP